MRSCARSEELRQAVATEDELSPSLAAHVAACTECAAACAAARRFESGLDAAVGELITDALPPSTVAAARAAPRPPRRPRWAGMALGAVATTALVAFAAIGIVTVGNSVADAVGSRLIGGADPTEQATVSVDCHLGDAAVEVTVETIGAGSGVSRIAYCMGVPVEVDAPRESDGRNAITCVRSVASGAGRVGQGAMGVAEADRDAYLGACTYVRDVDPLPDAGAILAAPSTPFASWDAASEAVGWSLHRPRWLPDGYELAALQGFGAATDPAAIDSVVAGYLRNGVLLSIDQFFIHEPDAFRVELTIPGEALGDVTTGQTTVGGSPAFWAQGVVEFTSGGPNLNVEALVLTWSDGEVGYRITSRGDDLETLRRIAESLGEE